LEQHAKECADVVVKDGDLSVAEKNKMEKRVCECILVRALRAYACGIARAVLSRLSLGRDGLRARRSMHALAGRTLRESVIFC
jgi:hypothetical protein